MPRLPRPLDDDELDLVAGGFAREFQTLGSHARPRPAPPSDAAVRAALGLPPAAPGAGGSRN